MKNTYSSPQRFFLSFLLVMAVIGTGSAHQEMPIIAYWGVPEQHNTVEEFKTFSECGFTVSLFPYSSLDKLVAACRNADKYGIKIIGKCPEMTDLPQTTATTLKKENGFFGYLLQDEPSAPEIRQQEKYIANLKQFDSTHVFYINLLPYSKPEWVEGSTKVKTYPEYLKVASSTSCQQLSFDIYPITTDGIRPTWYHNLEMIRQESLASRKPFWGFALSMPHDVPFTPDCYYPDPTLASLRLQIYSNLAYGAQAIQYFTYWTPGNDSEFHFHDAPMSYDGDKTKNYAVVQNMNSELRTVARLFYGAKVLSVHHLGAIPVGTTRQTEMPENVKSLKIVGRQGAIISQFEKDGNRYLAIVNKSHEEALTVRIRTRNDIPRRITKDLQEESMKINYQITAGDILIFRIKTA